MFVCNLTQIAMFVHKHACLFNFVCIKFQKFLCKCMFVRFFNDFQCNFRGPYKSTSFRFFIVLSTLGQHTLRVGLWCKLELPFRTKSDTKHARCLCGIWSNFVCCILFVWNFVKGFCLLYFVCVKFHTNIGVCDVLFVWKFDTNKTLQTLNMETITYSWVLAKRLTI